MIILFDEKNKCCGCTACQSICPEQAIIMQPDEEGFLYPIINESLCIDCGLCKKVCAFQIGYDTSNNLKPPEVYAFKHKSDEVRMNSSSGGAFSTISDYVLSENGIVYGAAYNENLRVIHKRAGTLQIRNTFRGSKYVQSDLGNVLSQIMNDLKNGQSVLFTGTACQTAGLSSYLNKSGIKNDRLLTIDFICHGVPSPLVFADFIDYCQKKNKRKIMDYHFRSKVNGWGHTEETIYENGKRDYTSALSQIHKELFYSNLCLRPACYNCKYTNILRPSDITMADFWGIENHLPEFNDKLGVSVIIINTDKGKSAYSYFKHLAITAASKIEDCAAKQIHLNTPSPLNPRRDEFWSDYLQHGFKYIIGKYLGYGFKKEFRHRLKNRLERIGLLNLIRWLRNIRKRSN